jgi:hypothetical protein
MPRAASSRIKTLGGNRIATRLDKQLFIGTTNAHSPYPCFLQLRDELSEGFSGTRLVGTTGEPTSVVLPTIGRNPDN